LKRIHPSFFRSGRSTLAQEMPAEELALFQATHGRLPRAPGYEPARIAGAHEFGPRRVVAARRIFFLQPVRAPHARGLRGEPPVARRTRLAATGARTGRREPPVVRRGPLLLRRGVPSYLVLDTPHVSRSDLAIPGRGVDFGAIPRARAGKRDMPQPSHIASRFPAIQYTRRISIPLVIETLPRAFRTWKASQGGPRTCGVPAVARRQHISSRAGRSFLARRRGTGGTSSPRAASTPCRTLLHARHVGPLGPPFASSCREVRARSGSLAALVGHRELARSAGERAMEAYHVNHAVFFFFPPALKNHGHEIPER
jgi:hypothetical protein